MNKLTKEQIDVLNGPAGRLCDAIGAVNEAFAKRPLNHVSGDERLLIALLGKSMERRRGSIQLCLEPETDLLPRCKEATAEVTNAKKRVFGSPGDWGYDARHQRAESLLALYDAADELDDEIERIEESVAQDAEAVAGVTGS